MKKNKKDRKKIIKKEISKKKDNLEKIVDGELFEYIQPRGGITFKEPNYIIAGDGYIRILHIYQLPKMLDDYWLDNIFNIPDTVATIDISTKDTTEVKKNINKSLQEEFSRARSAKDYMELYDAEQRQSELQQLLHELSAMGEVVKMLDFRLYVKGRNLIDLDDRCESILKNLEGDSYMATTFLNENKREWQALFESYTTQHSKKFVMPGQPLMSEQLAIGYVGDKLRGGFINEVAARSDFNQEVKHIAPKPHIKDLVDEINLAAANGGCRFIVYDVDEFLDSAAVIMNEIMQLKKANNAEPILIVPTLVASNQIVSEAHDCGIKKFINSNTNMSEKKSELIRCISGYYDANGRDELRKIEKIKEEKAKRKSAFKTIGVMGTCHRIGATTQAIQVVKYLQAKGYKACYVEMNNYLYPNMQLSRRENPEISYVVKAKLSLDCEFEDRELGMVTIEGVDMFYKQDRLSEILERDYDFYVYDYGVYTEKDFNKASFLKDNLKIIAAGANIVELDYTLNILQNIAYDKADLIFSFYPENEREEFLLWMNDFKAASRCYFTDYTPNPFLLSNLDLYDSLLHIEQKEDPNAEKEVKKSKFSFFKR